MTQETFEHCSHQQKKKDKTMAYVEATIGGKHYEANNGPSIAEVLEVEDAFYAITEKDFEAYRAMRLLRNQRTSPTIHQMRSVLALIQG